MKRILLAGILILTAGISASMAQAPPAGRPAAPPAGQAGAAAGAPAQAPVTEASLVQALGQSVQSGPDAMIKAAEALITAFPNTQYREAALSVEAAAYGDKKDNDAARAKWEDVLKINPKKYRRHGLFRKLAQSDARNCYRKQSLFQQASGHTCTCFQKV